MSHRISFENNFIPVKGCYAAYHDLESDTYEDVFIHSGRGTQCCVSYRDGGDKFNVLASDLGPPLNPDVTDRFKYFQKITRYTIQKRVRAMIVTGEGGIGKTHVIEEELGKEGMKEDTDYIKLKGHCTAGGLFEVLKERPDGLFIFDDMDTVLRDKEAGNILKAVLDTYGRRRVSWITKTKGTVSFDFTGAVIFISNMNIKHMDHAVITRTAMIDLFMTPAEKVHYMRQIMDNLLVGTTLHPDVKMEVIGLIDKYKNTIKTLSLRTLIKAFDLMEKTEGDLDIVRYQILNG